MYVVAVDFKTTDRPRAATYIVEEWVNAKWQEKERFNVESDGQAARRNFLLESNQRLIVEELSAETAIWDNEQMATKMVPVVHNIISVGEETEFSTEEEGEV